MSQLHGVRSDASVTGACTHLRSPEVNPTSELGCKNDPQRRILSNLLTINSDQHERRFGTKCPQSCWLRRVTVRAGSQNIFSQEQ